MHLVDLPGVPAAAVARLAAVAGRDVLARAAYGGRPGHPVLLGRAHWAGVRAAAVGDAGARGYLAGRADVVLVECGDLADPDDVDTPEQLAAFRRAQASHLIRSVGRQLPAELDQIRPTVRMFGLRDPG